MTEIKVKGTASMEFTVDSMIIIFNIFSSGNSAFSAVEKGKKTVNKFIRSLVDMGIDVSEIEMCDENTSQNFNRNTIAFSKKLKYKTTADLKLLEKIRNLITEDENITYSVSFSFSDIDSLNMQVIDKAFENSRAKAEHIAEKLNKHIIDAKDINYEVYNEQNLAVACGSARFLNNIETPESSIALKKEKIEKEISVVWLAE